MGVGGESRWGGLGREGYQGSLTGGEQTAQDRPRRERTLSATPPSLWTVDCGLGMRRGVRFWICWDPESQKIKWGEILKSKLKAKFSSEGEKSQLQKFCNYQITRKQSLI